MGVDPGSHIFTKVDIHPEKMVSKGRCQIWDFHHLFQVSHVNWVVASQIFFMFIPNVGEMIQIPILSNMFQMGWNHQLDEPGVVWM